MQPDTYVYIGLGLYLATHVLNRYLTEQNRHYLTADDKVKLVDGFSLQRSLSTYAPLSIMLIVFVLLNRMPMHREVIFTTGVVVVLAVSIALTVWMIGRLRELGLSPEYVRRFRIHSIAVQIGNIVAMSMFIMGMVRR